ncbi:toprim domain-containing protein [Kitasatospora sp. McL0602]|uniref:toprim domain-containing protein n=1 Tax=Kitasatospora sp. McL0602 TaxID=3439530 RepID=UPI003F8C6719
MQEILDRLEEWHDYQPGQWVARCPAHNDGKPSLWLNLKATGTVGLACRAGCDFEDIVAGMDLLPRHLFNVTADGLESVTEARPEPVSPMYTAALRSWLDSLPMAWGDPETARYVRRRFGILAGEGERLGLRYWPGPQPCPDWVPTSFVRYPRLVVPMRDFDGVVRGAQGRDLSGRCPVRWISLANPEGYAWKRFGVFRGPDPGARWIVCEGLSDPLTAVSAGFNAVGLRGAGMVRKDPEVMDEIAAGLRGLDVEVCGDNDRSGQRFAWSLMTALHERGVATTQLHVPRPFKDLTEWREHG